jgi:hypothetical protein
MYEQQQCAIPGPRIQIPRPPERPSSMFSGTLIQYNRDRGKGY